MESATNPAPTPQASTQGAKLPSAFSLFTPSMDALKFNLGTIILLFLAPLLAIVPLVILIILFSAMSYSSGTSTAVQHPGISAGMVVLILVGIVLYIAFIAVCIILAGGLAATALKSVQRQKMSFGQAFAVGKHYAWRLLGASFCTGFLIVIGFILFIVPGLFMLRRYYLTLYYLIDRDLKVFDAMKQCAAESKQFSGAIWGVIGVMFLIQLAGIVPFVGGIISLVLTVMYACAPAVRYLQIKEAASDGKHGANHQPLATPPTNPLPPHLAQA